MTKISNIIAEELMGRNPEECTEEELDLISRTVTLREIKVALERMMKIGQKSNHEA